MLARLPHTVGNRSRKTVAYDQWLADGVTVASALVTSSSATATINGTTVVDNKVIFFVNGGVLSETFTVSIQMTDSKGGIKHDTINFFVIAP